jgi:hypothetical protein
MWCSSDLAMQMNDQIRSLFHRHGENGLEFFLPLVCCSQRWRALSLASVSSSFFHRKKTVNSVLRRGDPSLHKEGAPSEKIR